MADSTMHDPRYGRATAAIAHPPRSLDTVIRWATDVIDAIGLLGIAVLVALESAFPPIPSELVLLLSGFNVSVGRFHLVAAIAAATVGSLLGAWILYLAGAVLHEDRMERFLAGFGRFLGLKRDDIHKANTWFERHGSAVIFFGRLIPIVRSLVSIPAGADRMNPWTFTFFTALGSLVWNTVWITVGWRLGDRWQQAERWSELIELVLVGVVTVIVGGLVLRRIGANRREAEEAATAPERELEPQH
jgi:membrane protein DedA with SNARE-associated domain